MEIDPFEQKCLVRTQTTRKRHLEVIEGIRARLIAGELPPLAAAAELTAEACDCIQAMLGIAVDEMAHKYGPSPGRFAVLGMGKLGGGELTLSSDLDVIFVFDGKQAAYDIAAADYYHRLSQRLIALLTTKSGYEVDARLRPHGDDGPLATPLSGLVDYLRQDCWTWEFQALTRLRAIAGDPCLADQVVKAARDGAAMRADGDILEQVADMRALMDEQRPPRHQWDLKLAPGGLVDIEFIAQALQLQLAADPHYEFRAHTDEAIQALVEYGALSRGHANCLRTAWAMYSSVRQFQAALDCENLGSASRGQRAILQRLLSASPAASRTRVVGAQRRVRDLFEQLVRRIELRAAA